MGAENASVRRHVYGGAHITTTIWQRWEYRRFLDAGKFGYFTSCGAAK